VLRRAGAEEVATGRVSGWIVVRDGWEMSVIRNSALPHGDATFPELKSGK
jgi:hypothetical protein